MDTSGIFAETRRIMFDNMIREYSKDLDFEYHYTKPSKAVYPFQYFWDTCFHIFILCALGELNHAKKHLQSLFALQEEDGFVGNILYWNNFFPARASDIFQFRPATLFRLNKPHMSGIIQPSFAAQALLRIYEETHDIEFVNELLPKLKKYMAWLSSNRDFDGDGLVSIVSTFESGMDWKPTFDPVLGFHHRKANSQLFFKVVSVDARNFLNNYNHRKLAKKAYFRVKDAGFNSIYAKDLDALANLCKITGDGDEMKYQDKSRQVALSILDLMYDEEHEAFFDVHEIKNQKLRIYTPTIFFPVVLSDVPSEIRNRVIERHFYQSDKFRTQYPLPSLSINSAGFNPHQSIYIWRGPTWIFYNWFLHKYLKEGHDAFRKDLMRSAWELIHKSGFREYYNPFTGKGLGAHEFTWTGLVIDMLHNEKCRRENNSFKAAMG